MTKIITLKNLSEATAQEVFDQVKDHLLKQNQKSLDSHINGGMNCLYRNNKGLKCAAGCLIADDEYDIKMEQTSWFKLTEEGKVPIEHVDLIQDLQSIHDGWNVAEWKDRLMYTAGFHGLKCVFS